MIPAATRTRILALHACACARTVAAFLGVPVAWVHDVRGEE